MKSSIFSHHFFKIFVFLFTANCSLIVYHCSAQQCPTVTFNNIAAGSPYNCSKVINLKASTDSVSPGFSFVLRSESPWGYKFLKHMDTLFFYVNGALASYVLPAPKSDSTLSSFTVYAQYLNPTYSYELKFCARDGDGIFPWSLYDHAGNTLLQSGIDTVSRHKCFTVKFSSLMGTEQFSGLGVTDNKNGTGTFNPAVSGPGTFDITYSWDDWHGCAGIYTQTITVIGPKANAGKDTSVCRGNSVAIGGKPTASGGASYYKYSWSPASSLNTSTISNPVSKPNVSTTYTVTVTDNFGRGCKGVDTVIVKLKNNPNVSAGKDTSVCNGNNVTLLATGGATYQWNNAQSSSSISVSPKGTSKYYVTITDINKCIAVDSVNVTVYPNPVAGFTVKFANGPNKYTFINTSSNGKNYLWTFGDGDTSHAKNPVHAYSDSKGKHTVLLTVNNGPPDYCQDTISHETFGSDITKIPNIFTPGSDHNTNFSMQAENLASIDLMIFNRWGAKVFEKTSIEYDNTPSNSDTGSKILLWNAKTNNGNEADPGVYFYILKAQGLDNVVYNEHGTITLIK